MLRLALITQSVWGRMRLKSAIFLQQVVLLMMISESHRALHSSAVVRRLKCIIRIVRQPRH